MSGTRAASYQSWLIGELVLAGVLAIGTAGVLVLSGLHVEPEPPARLAADTAIAIVAAIVAVLGLVRFEVEGRTFDLFLAAGFAVVAASTLVFDLKPLVLGEVPSPAEVWASLFADVAAALIVLAAFLASRLANRRRAVVLAGGGVAAIVALAWPWARRPQAPSRWSTSTVAAPPGRPSRTRRWRC